MNVHLQAGSDKTHLRRRLRTARRELPAPFRAEAAVGFTRGLEQFGALLPRGPVLAYLPSPEEPPLEQGLLELLTSRDLWLPVVKGPRRMAWCRWRRGMRFEPSGPGGLLEPVGPRRDTAPDDVVAVLVPAVAVGEDRVRLGMGGGFYDTFLAELEPGIERVGCVFHREVLPAGTVPADPWDARLPRVLTERGLRELPLSNDAEAT